MPHGSRNPEHISPDEAPCSGEPGALRPFRRPSPACPDNPSTIGSLITPGIWPGVLNWDDTASMGADRYGDWLVSAR